MIDDSPEALAEVIAFGNWWHGSYRTGEGFFSRSGVAQAILNASSVANTQKSVVGRDAHLVDFDRPAVETPAAEAAIGMERWNKAILYGKEKYYSILGTFKLGVGGWPYRAPDGIVWHLQARFFSPGTVIVFGNVLRSDITVPTVQLAEIEVPVESTTSAWSWQTTTDSTFGFTVNFSPKGGAQAAAHRYGPQKVPLWIVEFEVTGGSATTPPVISCAVTFSQSNASEYLTPNPTLYIADTLVNPETGQIYTAAENDSIHPKVRISTNNEFTTKAQVLAVVYNAAGTRCVLRLETLERYTWTYSQWTLIAPYTYQRVDEERQEWKLRFKSNDVVQAEIASDYRLSWTYHWERYHDQPTFMGLESVVTGGLYQKDPVWKDLRTPGEVGQSYRWFTTMSASNTFLIGITAFGNGQPDATRIIGYASAEGAAMFGFPSPWDGASESMQISINPLTGVYSADTTVYF